MMDAQAESYQPFLSDWLREKNNVHVIPHSGITWTELHKMFEEHIGPSHANQPQEPNDTLLVTANIATFPKKALFSFDSPATMLLYQLMTSIRTSSLLQRYGLVRMLIWTNDEQKHRVLPRSLQGRKRFAFETELSCEWVHEVAGYDDPQSNSLYLRDEWLNLESAADTVQRMKEQGITTPIGRETRLLSAVEADRSIIGRQLAGFNPPNISRPFKKELEAVEAAGADAKARLVDLRRRSEYDARDAKLYMELLHEQEAVLALDPASPEFAAADRAFNERFDHIKKNQRNEFHNIRDCYHLFRHQPFPAMLWDRRAYEPLAVQLEEFYPNAPCTLLDIQPKAMNPLLTQFGANSSRSGDTSNYLLQAMFKQPAQPVLGRAMDGVWPGFADMADRAKGLCPSLYDPKLGGSAMTDHGSLSIRALNERQWAELVGAWMEWPFRPSYNQLIGRFTEDEEVDEDEGRAAKILSL
jgi:transcription factor 1